MKIKLFFLVTMLLILKSTAFGQDPDNSKPMFGNVQKSTKYKEADDKFIETVTKEYGTKDSALKAYVALGWRHLYKNDLETAIKRFNQAWLLNPNNPDPYYGFYAFEKLKDKDIDAAQYLELGKKYDYKNTGALRAMDFLIRVFAHLNQNSRVIDICLKAIQIDSSAVYPYRTLGYYYGMANDSTNALKYYKLAIFKNPNDTLSFINRGCYYQSIKQYDNAIKDFDRVLSMNNQYLQGYSNRGMLLFEQKKYDLAIVDFGYVLTRVADKEKGFYYRRIGECKIKMNDKNGGCKYLNYAKNYGDHFLGNDSLKQLIEDNCK